MSPLRRRPHCCAATRANRSRRRPSGASGWTRTSRKSSSPTSAGTSGWFRRRRIESQYVFVNERISKLASGIVLGDERAEIVQLRVHGLQPPSLDREQLPPVRPRFERRQRRL